jgi:predicted nucleic acid-binding protein
MFLLDTNVISAARKHDPFVAKWMSSQGRYDLWLSVITLGEIARGVSKKQRKDPATARHLALWYQQLRRNYVDRIFDIDDQIVEEWGRIDAIRTRSTTDGLIAATAIVHGMTVVTRNVADFADTGATVLNPWDI